MPDTHEVESNEHSKRNAAGGLRVTGRQEGSCWASCEYKGAVRFGDLWCNAERKQADVLGGPGRVGQAKNNTGQMGGTLGSPTGMVA